MTSVRRCWAVLGTVLGAALPASGAGQQADIHAAARLGDLPRLIKLLDENPALARARTAEGATPLHAAAAGRQLEALRLLLRRGAAAGAADRRGRTALHIAASASDAGLLEPLLAAGADPNAADADGQTPLHLAARHLAGGPMRRLLAAGAQVNARDRQGQTPLQVLGSASRAPQQREALYERLREWLIANGAEPAPRATGSGGEQGQGLRGGYRSWPEIEQLLRDWAAAYPQICELHELGASVEGRHLWALRISDNLGLEEDEPEFKYVSTMHGDEWTGSEMCLFFIEHLLTGYGSDPRISDLVNQIDIWVVPVMNPDGFVANTRYNAHGVDLNRDFPEGTRGDDNSSEGREPETAAIMNWSLANSFTLSANFHAGALVVNYPYDNDGLGDTYSPTPDDDLFIWISQEYSRHNLPMWNSPYFYHGITNGADWYAISGGMQDWHYRYMGDNEVTIELSDSKRPPYWQIPRFWEDNRESMLAYMETCLLGVRGIVTDADSGAPLPATVTVPGRAHEVHTDPDVGDYHRMLLPGRYTLRFVAAGYDLLLASDVLVGPGQATRLDVALGPPAEVLFPNGGELLDAGRPTVVRWSGNPAARFQVQYSDNYGELAPVFDGFESGRLGPDYRTGGAAEWFVTSGSAHEGAYSARAGQIGDKQRCWLARSVAGGELSFWYRVSSEAGYDFFNLYIDQRRALHVSGDSGWVRYAATLPPGAHELRWEYVKDYSVAHGYDTVWIDELATAQDNTAWTDIVPLSDPGVMSAEWVPPAPGTDYKVRVRAYYDGDFYGFWDESDETFEVTGQPPGDLNGDGCVDQADLGLLLGDWGCAGGDCLGDLDGDGDTDQADLAILLAHWGEGCS